MSQTRVDIFLKNLEDSKKDIEHIEATLTKLKDSEKKINDVKNDIENKIKNFKKDEKCLQFVRELNIQGAVLTKECSIWAATYLEIAKLSRLFFTKQTNLILNSQSSNLSDEKAEEKALKVKISEWSKRLDGIKKEVFETALLTKTQIESDAKDTMEKIKSMMLLLKESSTSAALMFSTPQKSMTPAPTTATTMPSKNGRL